MGSCSADSVSRERNRNRPLVYIPHFSRDSASRQLSSTPSATLRTLPSQSHVRGPASRLPLLPLHERHAALAWQGVRQEEGRCTSTSAASASCGELSLPEHQRGPRVSPRARCRACAAAGFPCCCSCCSRCSAGGRDGHDGHHGKTQPAATQPYPSLGACPSPPSEAALSPDRRALVPTIVHQASSMAGSVAGSRCSRS